MPNTLAHIAFQTLALRPFVRNGNFFPQALLGCVIPDLPWILQRLIQFSPIAVDPYTLRAYATVQAALFMSVVLAAACALLFARYVQAFVTVTAGCILHLCLDASEIKWANGVHFLAPLDWHQVNWGLVWPEHMAIDVISLIGIPVFGYFAWKSASQSVGFKFNRWRIFGCAIFILAYFSAPIIFFEGPYQGNSHYLQTLTDIENRPGQYIEFDRLDVFRKNNHWYARTYAGESIQLDSFDPSLDGTYSLRGHFLSPKTITVTGWHRHKGVRDLASIMGLFLVLSWALPTIYRQSGRHDNP